MSKSAVSTPTKFTLGCGAMLLLSCGGCLVIGAIFGEPYDPELAAAKKAERAKVAAEQAAEYEEQAAIAKAAPKMDRARYARCRPGMTYEEVVAIVGPPDEEMAQSSVGGVDTVIYMWKAGFVANANMTFQDGKLVSKAQAGL